MKIFLAVLFFLISAGNSLAADFTLLGPTLDGKKFDLKEQKGKIIIVNFWAYWCADCRKELPILEEIYREYKARGVEIIGVNIDGKKDLKKILQAVKEVSYPNLIFDEADEISFEEPSGIPLNYIFDRQGKMVAKLDGREGKLVKKDFEEVLRKIF